MRDKMRKIGVIGGTFDPIHYGHLLLAEQAREGAQLEKVIFIPTHVSPFKIDQPPATAEHRLEMVRLAIEGNHNFEASDIELKDTGVSYTVRTLEACQASMGDRVNLYFITGTDSFLSMERWKDAENIFRKFSLIVGSRPRYKDKARNKLAQSLTERYGTEIVNIYMPKIDISSTDIKERIASGRSIRYLLPENVARYIDEKRLYQLLATPEKSALTCYRKGASE
jgi:nicotinate-nucleotide adenylyltransferase